ncbi:MULTISPECIES: ABC transporter ATP-binding protein [Corynebacterium]|uniref:ABC transporter ATP-binding protein n=1 Tax=Corynebacterium gottingense TaxID=2041036 RepID=A0ABX9UJK7_9CORY|nr:MULTISPECIES: ABC transporter ATP-binding protein [Corynebacterium]RMD19643.1 ABC transporter ATP-binding protein [Corynebacterium gottingense]WJZ12992.1 Sulfate/thiosulfate import ATP-binding protein CysA [Corynebacterium gottingense]WJZ15316.1 Sulfate/thiosulfate import ATP-binding protein CysA [Corynebacterium gottingense]
MSEIQLEHLTVAFPDGTVGLNNLDANVQSGEFLALVGPSGSGKTTLLRTLAGFLSPTSGTIRIGGRDVSAVPPEHRNMGMVFQQHAVWPHMTVEANVAYPLKQAKVPASQRRSRVEEVLELVGLAGYGARKPDSLSGGQRQRVALARAIVARPSVLLLDEALSALDEPLRDGLRRELVALTRTHNLTTVHVTHDRKEALAIADRIAVLRDGVIEQIAAPADLLARPASAWVASFMGDATVLPGRINGGRVVVDSLPELSWPAELSGTAAADGTEVEVAVRPSMVHLDGAGHDGATATAMTMIVTSALYERDGYSVSLRAGDHEFRAFAPGSARPEIDTAAVVRIDPPLVFASTPKEQE